MVWPFCFLHLLMLTQTCGLWWFMLLSLNSQQSPLSLTCGAVVIGVNWQEATASCLYHPHCALGWCLFCLSLGILFCLTIDLKP